MKRTQLLFTVSICVTGTLVLGILASQLHNWFPSLFSLPSAFPYVDSFIMVVSIVTTFYMIQKKIECWIMWILIDIVATILYYVKEIKFFSLEYLVFTGIAFYGLYNWIKEYKSYTPKSA